jgi:hypothetical protein
VAGSRDGGRTVATPAAAPTPARKSSTGVIAAAVIGVAVLGGGGYYMFGRGDTAVAPSAVSADSGPAAPGIASTTPSANIPASPASNPATDPKGMVNPPGAAGRTMGEAAPSPTAPVAAQDPFAKWKAVIDGETPTDDEAQVILNDMRAIVASASGDTKAKAWYLMGQATMKLGKTDDACTLWQRAENLNSGMFATRARKIREGLCQ